MKRFRSGYFTTMWVSVLAIPFFWAVFLWLLPWLERMALTPEEHAHRIQTLLRDETPEEIERKVAEMLASAFDDLRPARSRGSRTP